MRRPSSTSCSYRAPRLRGHLAIVCRRCAALAGFAMTHNGGASATLIDMRPRGIAVAQAVRATFLCYVVGIVFRRLLTDRVVTWNMVAAGSRCGAAAGLLGPLSLASLIVPRVGQLAFPAPTHRREREARS